MSELTITRTVADVTRDIRIKTGQFLMDAIDIGRLLFEAKAMVPAGQWSKYIEEELPFSHSWANNYMRLYKELGKDQLSLFADSQAIGNLRPTQALELLALPAEEREDFVQTHDVENMSTRELHQAIRELDEAKKAQQEAEERAAEAEASLEDAQQAAENRIRQLEQAAKDEKTVTNAMRSRAEMAEKAQAVAQKRESEALEKAADLKKKLDAAKAEVEKLRKSPVIPDDLMKSMQKEAEEFAAQKAAADLQKKVEAAEDAARKAQQERQKAEESARSAREQLEAAQKNAKLSDPDLMAVQVLGQQILTQWNVLLGHRKKIFAKDAVNAAPVDAFLRKMLDTMAMGVEKVV